MADSPEPVSYDDDLYADVRKAFNPPSEDTPAETATEKPAETPAEPDKAETKSDDRARDEQGRFVKAETEPKQPAEQTSVQQTQPTQEAQPQPTEQQPAQAAPVAAPPPGWSIKSKAEWDKLPEHIRADIVKREKEVNDGFAQYAGMKELQPYVERARREGTTLKAALDNYLGIEDLLRQNPIQGILRIANNFGLAPQRLAAELAPYAGQSNVQPMVQPGTQTAPVQEGQIDPNMLQQWMTPVVAPLAQQVNQLTTLFQQQQQAEQSRQMNAVSSIIERFAADPAHRYFHDVESTIAQLFEGGVVQNTGDYAADLQTAYDMACNLNPEIREALFNERTAKAEEDRKQKEKEAAEKAKLASRSITGSPSTPSTKDEPDNLGDSIEDDVRRALRAHAA